MFDLRHNWMLGLLLLAVSTPSFAGSVLRVSGHRAAVENDTGEPWYAGDKLCVRHQKELICGKVIRATSKGAIINFRRTGVAVGDSVEGSGDETENRGLAAEEDGVDSEARLRKLHVREGSYAAIQGPRFNAVAGGDINYFDAQIQYAFAENYVVAVGPFYNWFNMLSLRTNIVGGGLSLIGYLHHPYKGMWFQLGGKVGSAQTTSYQNGSIFSGSATTGNQLAIEGVATLGYRWLWDFGLNLGLGGGIKYINLGHSDVLHLSATYWYPAFQLDVGYAF